MHADALATMASKIYVPREAIEVSIVKRTLQATATVLFPGNPTATAVARNLKDFTKSTMSFTFEAVVELRLEPYPLARSKKNFNASTIFLWR